MSILSIAHRIDTIIDFDRIIVMDAGSIAEIGSPAELVERQGIFYDMIQKTGADSCQKLLAVVKNGL